MTPTIIRKADSSDIEKLVCIHRDCFPNEVMYQVPKTYCKKWWALLIASDFAEIYVLSIDGDTAGFGTLKINAINYQKQKERHKAPLLIRMYTIFVNPRLFVSIPRKIICWFHSLNNTSDIGQKQKIEPSSDCTWIDPLVVSPKYRGRGLGTSMLEFLVERTIILRKDTIALTVDLNNGPAISLYENCGWVRTGNSHDGCFYFYKKTLKYGLTNPET